MYGLHDIITLEIAWQCGPSVLMSLSLSLLITPELRILEWLGMVPLHSSVPEVFGYEKNIHDIKT